MLDSSIGDSEFEIENCTTVRNDRNGNGVGYVCMSGHTSASMYGPICTIMILKQYGKTFSQNQSLFYSALSTDTQTKIRFMIVWRRDQLVSEVILGDLNTNILKKDTSIFKSFMNYCHFNVLNRLISQTTRVCSAAQPQFGPDVRPL